MKTLKPKKCRQCKTIFTPANSFQVVCTPKCAISYAKLKESKRVKASQREAEKARRAQHRADKERIKTTNELIQELQPIFNKYIRLRDKDKGCISCGTMNAKFDAGHYFSTGAYPNLRFWEKNCHKQCAQCNSHAMKGGNLIQYRLGLIHRFGGDWYEEFEKAALESPPSHFLKDELRDMKKHYRAKIRELENE